MRFTFLLPVIGDARYHKRISALAALGADIQVLGFERPYYAGRPLPYIVTPLGHIEHGRYLDRIPRLMKALPRVRAAIQQTDVVYTFGLDMLILAYLAIRVSSHKPQVVYEVGDIRQLQVGNTLTSSLVRLVERSVVSTVSLLVVTSKAFHSEYYLGCLGLSQVSTLVVENKVDPNLVPPLEVAVSPKVNNRPLRIGYFGLLRCRKSWEALKVIAAKGGDRVEILLRGIPFGLPELEHEARLLSNVRYDGPYTVPDDLPHMYASVDLVWIAHYHSSTNLKWARANRFYEACYFQRPVIAQVGTEDGNVVSQYGIGLCIDLSNSDKVADEVLSLTPTTLSKWVKNLRCVPKSVYTYTGEHERILAFLQSHHPHTYNG